MTEFPGYVQIHFACIQHQISRIERFIVGERAVEIAPEEPCEITGYPDNLD
ncbi:MAG: hypothetical protein WBP54_11595 [Pelodictyon phaeoclathratiforme]